MRAACSRHGVCASLEGLNQSRILALDDVRSSRSNPPPPPGEWTAAKSDGALSAPLSRAKSRALVTRLAHRVMAGSMPPLLTPGAAPSSPRVLNPPRSGMQKGTLEMCAVPEVALVSERASRPTCSGPDGETARRAVRDAVGINFLTRNGGRHRSRPGGGRRYARPPKARKITPGPTHLCRAERQRLSLDASPEPHRDFFAGAEPWWPDRAIRAARPGSPRNSDSPLHETLSRVQSRTESRS